MARRRYISTEISTDADVAALAAHGGTLPVLLYTWAIPHADDWGRLTGDAVQFRLSVCPGLDVTVAQVDAALDQIAAAGLWQRYTSGGKRCIAFPREAFNRHQSYIPKEKREQEGQGGSAFPPPEESETPQNAEERRETPQNPVSPSPSPSPSPSVPTQHPSGASSGVRRSAPPAASLVPLDVPHEAQRLATEAYDAMNAAGRRPSDQRWVGKAIGRIKKLTPEARAEFPQMIAWALLPGQPGFVASWLTSCDFPQLIEQFGLRPDGPLQPVQARASPPSEPRSWAALRELAREGGFG